MDDFDGGMDEEDSKAHYSTQTKRRKKVLNETNIKNDLNKSCGCSRNCHQFLTYDVVLRWRKKYHTLKMGPKQQNKLIELFKISLFQDVRKQTLHMVEGSLICKRAWFTNLLAVGERTYYRTKQAVKTNRYVHQPNIGSMLGVRGNIALGYMKYYVSIVGDHSPERDRIIMPLGITVKDIFKKYRTFYSDAIKPSRFYEIWKENMKHVSQQRNFRISKCNICFQARRLLEQNNTPETEADIIKHRDEHLERQQNERQSYYQRRAMAIANPEERTSIIVDGMDQKKTDLPHFRGWTSPKDCDQANMLKTHVVGVEVHGKALNMIVDYLQWPHDSNLTLCCMLMALCTQGNGGRLTKYLDIQLDNCARENKNKYFIGLVALMVRMGLVEEVTMSFLMVGHTHEDIDGRFSRISVQLSRKDAMTLPQLLSIIGLSLANGKMEGMLLPTVFDIKKWLIPTLNELHNHSYPHVYRIFIDRPDHVGIQYKNWSTDEEWMPKCGEAPLEIFKMDILGRQRLPVGEPEQINPSFGDRQDLDAIKRNILKLEKYMVESDSQWWSNFLQEPCQTEQNPIWFFNQLLPWTGANSTETGVTAINDLVSPLDIAMSRERCIPQVYSGPRRANPSVSCQQTSRVLDGYMIAALDRGELFIGEIADMTDDDVRVQLYTGTVGGTWNHFLDCNNRKQYKTYPKSSINEEWIFRLNKNERLPQNIKELLKRYG